jgi:hypothetical protein
MSLAAYLVKRDKELDILGFCGLARSLLLPSWVPDLTAKQIPKMFGQDIPCQQRKRIRWLRRSTRWFTLRSRFWTTSPQFKRLAQVPRIATSWSHGSGKYLLSTGSLTASWAARGRKLLLATYARMPLMRTSSLRRFMFPHSRCDREQTTLLLKQGPHRPRPVQRPAGRPNMHTFWKPGSYSSPNDRH